MISTKMAPKKTGQQQHTKMATKRICRHLSPVADEQIIEADGDNPLPPFRGGVVACRHLDAGRQNELSSNDVVEV